jgi:hypothetical protein
MSLVESLTNVAIGFGVAVLTQAIAFPSGSTQRSARTSAFGAIFTAVSIVRSFALRRVFEHLRVRRSRNRQRSPVAAIAAPGSIYVRPPFKRL